MCRTFHTLSAIPLVPPLETRSVVLVTICFSDQVTAVCAGLCRRKKNLGLVSQPVVKNNSATPVYQKLLTFLLLSLIWETSWLHANDYVLDQSGQLVEIPILISEELTGPTLFVGIDGEDCDSYTDSWCQRYGGESSCIGLPQKQCWPRWFASASGLVMTRSLPDGTTSTGPGGLAVSTRSASASWPGGLDLRLGRWFGERQEHAIELIYWGVYNIGSSAPQQTGGSSGVLSRSDTINNIEINWLYAPETRPEFHQGNKRVNWMWLAGFRFFQLEDQLSLGVTSPAFDLDTATNNNLFGGQFGGRFDWEIAPRMRFVVVPKFLLAGNASSNRATQTNGATTNVRSTVDVFSWLGSVDTSVAWDLTDRWSLWLGYRVVGVGNIAQADGQWPSGLPATSASLGGIATGSESIIHGAFAGFESHY
ncbi:MAG: hypothetical protein HOD99_03755 [Planctomycetaceae bacterium]|nr:hypothetical protein [Planctomycetaceae bacterium]